MTQRSKWAAAPLLALVLALMATSANAEPSAQLGAGAGWRIAEVFEGHNYLDPQAIAASGARNAWLLGLVPNPVPSFVTQHWTGRRWQDVALPAALGNVIGPWCL